MSAARYAEIRKDICSGDLLAWTHRGWSSWYDLQVQAVRIFTRSEYAHVGIAWSVGGRMMVLEAVRPLVRIFPLSKLLPCYWVPHDGLWGDEAETFALAQVGKPYSRRQAIAAFLGTLQSGADDAWQCAEFAQAVLARTGHPLTGRATPSAVVNEMLDRHAPLLSITA